MNLYDDDTTTPLVPPREVLSVDITEYLEMYSDGTSNLEVEDCDEDDVILYPVGKHQYFSSLDGISPTQTIVYDYVIIGAINGLDLYVNLSDLKLYYLTIDSEQKYRMEVIAQTFNDLIAGDYNSPTVLTNNKYIMTQIDNNAHKFTSEKYKTQ